MLHIHYYCSSYTPGGAGCQVGGLTGTNRRLLAGGRVMEGAKLCHLRDLQKACATLEGDDFKTWVQDKKAWYREGGRKNTG